MRFHGDMLLTTPVISTLKQNYPNAEIDVLLYQDTMPILSVNSDIHALYGIKNKKNHGFSKIYNFLSLLLKLRRNTYDLVVNLTDQWIIAILVRSISAPVKLSQLIYGRKSKYWNNSFTHLVLAQGENIVTKNLSILNPLGLTKIYNKTTMSYRKQDWETIKKKLFLLGIRSNYVVIQPTARQFFKCWDDKKFSQVIDSLSSRGYKVVLTSSPCKADINIINHIVSHCKMKPIIKLAGKTSFPELGALIAHAVLFIGVDSAPIHIAAAVNTPIICLFGATNHIAWRPWSKNVVQFWSGDYQPVPARNKLDRTKRYLSIIPASDVIKAIEKMLPKNIIL